MPTELNLDVVVTRGGIVESRHRVHAAVVDARGALIARAGDPELVTFARSCAKPFQVMPALAFGTFEALGWDVDELALACASHGGEPEHVALASSMLRSARMSESDLACGVHEPLSRRGAQLAGEAATPVTRVHNNCSGKHAAMLAHARTRGWPIEGYERAGHPLQIAVEHELATWCDMRAGSMAHGTDGCRAVTFALPLRAMALAFARLGSAAERGEEVPARIVRAMTTRPLLVGGTDRFDTVLMEETRGRVLAKVGAEGVHALAILNLGIGVVLKAEDGAIRAQHPAALRALQLLGALPDELPPRLAPFLRAPVTDTRGEAVGETRSAD
ncbi:MAG: asparaginase [Gemmatimonadaceae bacterium]